MADAKKSEWMRGREKTRLYKVDFKKGRFSSIIYKQLFGKGKFRETGRTQKLRTSLLKIIGVQRRNKKQSLVCRIREFCAGLPYDELLAVKIKVELEV